jgi:hypothetical protein
MDSYFLYLIEELAFAFFGAIIDLFASLFSGVLNAG